MRGYKKYCTCWAPDFSFLFCEPKVSWNDVNLIQTSYLLLPLCRPTMCNGFLPPASAVEVIESEPSFCLSVCVLALSRVSQSITKKKKKNFGQKDCTIWETRDVCERSGVFIGYTLTNTTNKGPWWFWLKHALSIVWQHGKHYREKLFNLKSWYRLGGSGHFSCIASNYLYRLNKPGFNGKIQNSSKSLLNAEGSDHYNIFSESVLCYKSYNMPNP